MLHFVFWNLEELAVHSSGIMLLYLHQIVCRLKTGSSMWPVLASIFTCLMHASVFVERDSV